MLKTFRRALLSLLAFILIVEEWLWDGLTVLGRWLFRALHLARFEFWLAQASRWVALLAFLIPLLVVMPLNIAAFYLLAKGRVLQGVGLEIFAKLLGTLLVARVFALTRRQLLTFGWFSWLYSTITRCLGWAHGRLASTAMYKALREIKASFPLRKRPGE